MSLAVLQDAIELGMIFSIMSLGVFLSFRVLNIPDLTIDGSLRLVVQYRQSSRKWGIRFSVFSWLCVRRHGRWNYRHLTNEMSHTAIVSRHFDNDGTVFHKSEDHGRSA